MTAAGSLGWAVLCVGWLLAAWLAVLALGMRRRLERAASAEHEIRGPLAALTLGVEQVRRGRAGGEIASVLDAQLDRARAGLSDLTAALAGARRSRAAAPPARPTEEGVSLERLARQAAAGWSGVAARAGGEVRFDWRGGRATVVADRGRLAQALGNLLANAIEHGGGEVELRGRRVGRAVRVEVADAGGRRSRAPSAAIGSGAALGRGRGLAIASRAVEESGGTLEIVTGARGTTAALELPVAER